MIRDLEGNKVLTDPDLTPLSRSYLVINSLPSQPDSLHRDNIEKHSFSIEVDS